MKEWNAHERNEDKEVEILDFNDKQKKKRRDKTRQVQEGQSTSSLVRCRHRERQKNERRTTITHKEYADRHLCIFGTLYLYDGLDHLFYAV